MTGNVQLYLTEDGRSLPRMAAPLDRIGNTVNHQASNRQARTRKQGRSRFAPDTARVATAQNARKRSSGNRVGQIPYIGASS